MDDRRERVETIILKALKSLNEERDHDQQISIGLNTPLFGAASALDSLSLVSVIVDVETAIRDAFGHTVALTDDHALSRPISPFTSVSALADYTIEVLEEQTKAL